MKSSLRPFKAVAAAATCVILGGVVLPGSAQAVTVNVNSAPIAFANGAGDPVIGTRAGVGFSHRYANVVTVGGVAIDAIVSVVSITNLDSDDNHASGADNLLDELDDSGSPGDAIRLGLDVFGLDNQSGDTNFQGEAVVRVAFLQAGTQNAATLQNVVINVKDIDSRQFVEFAAISSYLLTSTSNVQVATNTTDPSLVPAGSTRFLEPNGASSSNTNEQHWAQVSFNQLSFVDIKLGARESGSAYFGLEFSAATFTAATTSVNVAAPSYTVSYNNNGSNNPAPASSTGSGAITIAAAPSRPGFTFAGWNTAINGTGIVVPAGSTLTPSANITLFAQWTAVTTTTAAPRSSGQGAQPTNLPATGSDTSNRVLAMVALSLIGLGFAGRLARRTSQPPR